MKSKMTGSNSKLRLNSRLQWTLMNGDNVDLDASFDYRGLGFLG